jgi:hypothetical protein
MSDNASTDELHIISYLLYNTEDNQVLGYSELAARVHYLIEEIRNDDNISNTIAEGLDELIETTEDGMIKWDSLRSFLENAMGRDTGPMYLSIENEETDPNKWEYKFKSNAPEAVLETKIGDLAKQDQLLKQKIINSANENREDIYKEVYPQ